MQCDSNTHYTGGSENRKKNLNQLTIVLLLLLTPGSSAKTSEVAKITSAQDSNLMSGWVSRLVL